MTVRQWTDSDYQRLSEAIELSRHCPPADGAYSVGAIIIDRNGEEMATGYSRELDPHVHAEEAALSKVVEKESALTGATLYSTLEPCSERKSRPLSCAQLILASGIPRVVIAWREPSLFVADCQGVETLTAAGVTVVEIPELADVARRVNAHLPRLGP
ncbi:deaminase [Streptomyces zaomyceticus]|uniref:deaminase n=1 Tax=Streptomyces zaomyceticus TaxID=68286 RepID=UPI00386F1362